VAAIENNAVTNAWIFAIASLLISFSALLLCFYPHLYNLFLTCKREARVNLLKSRSGKIILLLKNPPILQSYFD
jgi:hypothetical protein